MKIITKNPNLEDRLISVLTKKSAGDMTGKQKTEIKNNNPEKESPILSP